MIPYTSFLLLLLVLGAMLSSSALVTIDHLVITSVSQKQLPTSGAQLIVVAGGGWSESTILRVGDTNCDRTTWESPTVLKCKASPGVGKALDIEVLDHSKAFTVVDAVSYEGVNQKNLELIFISIFGVLNILKNHSSTTS